MLAYLASDFKQFRKKMEGAPHTRQLVELFYLGNHFMVAKDARNLAPSLFHMFKIEVERALHPLPSEEDLRDFAENMLALKKKKFPENSELCLDCGDWGKVWSNPHEPRFIEHDALVKEKKQEFQGFIIEHLKKLEKIYQTEKNLPLIAWCVRSLGGAAKNGRLNWLSTNNWKALYKIPENEKAIMPWTRIGYVLDFLIVAGKVAKEDCVAHYEIESYFRPLWTVVLPQFDHNLQMLGLAEQAKLDDLASLKAKVLAGLVTAGVSLGHVVVQRFFPSECCQAPYIGVGPNVTF